MLFGALVRNRKECFEVTMPIEAVESVGRCRISIYSHRNDNGCSVWITAVVAGREKRDGSLSPFRTTFPGPSECYNLPVVINENERAKGVVVVVVVAIERSKGGWREEDKR